MTKRKTQLLYRDTTKINEELLNKYFPDRKEQSGYFNADTIFIVKLWMEDLTNTMSLVERARDYYLELNPPTYTHFAIEFCLYSNKLRKCELVFSPNCYCINKHEPDEPIMTVTVKEGGWCNWEIYFVNFKHMIRKIKTETKNE